MSPHDDLPLFAWRPPECVVLPFPQVRRVGKIRKAASVLAGSTEKAARAYERQMVETLVRQLKAAGIAPEVIEKETVAFRSAVAREIGRHTCLTASKPDGGAA